MDTKKRKCVLHYDGPTPSGTARRGPPGRIPGVDTAACDRGESAGNATDDALRSKTPRERWMMLLKLICAKYPHCIMYGVHIADGVIISCESMQQSLLFGPSPALRDGVEPAFDSNWQALEALCKRMGTGQLAELRFSDGRPVRAKTTPRGRRFRYFINED